MSHCFPPTPTKLYTAGAFLADGATTFIGHNSSVVSVSWSPDGNKIASGSDDTTIKVSKG